MLLEEGRHTHDAPASESRPSRHPHTGANPPAPAASIPFDIVICDLMLPGLALPAWLQFLNPLGDALFALSSWMPSTVLHALTNGAGDLFAAAGMPGTGTLPAWAWMLGTCLIWLVLAGGAWIAVGRKRGV